MIYTYSDAYTFAKMLLNINNLQYVAYWCNNAKASLNWTIIVKMALPTLKQNLICSPLVQFYCTDLR